MKALFTLLILTVGLTLHAQLAINTDGSAPDNSAMLDVKSTTKGLLVPRMTMAQRNAISSPANGLMIFQTDNTPGYYFNDGSIGSPSWVRLGQLMLPYLGSVTADVAGITVLNSGTTDISHGIIGSSTAVTGYTAGVHGISASTSGRGISGFASASSGNTYGAMGISKSTSGTGVYGTADALSGTNFGVYGSSNSPGGYGVYGSAQSCGTYGLATASTGETFGIYGGSLSTSGSGVYGKAFDLTGSNYGVTGRSDSPLGTGIYGISGATTGAGCGVFGISLSNQGSYGVKGISYATSGTNTGVYGGSFATDGFGVYGFAPNMGIYGKASDATTVNYGVTGYSASTSGTGVYGVENAASGTTYGIRGFAASPDGYGVYGTSIKYGVYGFAGASSGAAYGVYGLSTSGSGIGTLGNGRIGVRGESASSTGIGIDGYCSSATGATRAVQGSVLSPDGYSGYFVGSKFFVGSNVGIGPGAENPGAKLEVAGQVKITGGIPGAGKVLTSDAGGLASWQSPAAIKNPGGSSGSIQFNNAGSFGGDDKLFWDNTGKRLGLGTTSPSRDFTIHGGDREASVNFVNNLTGATWFDGLTVQLAHANDGWNAQMWCYENYPLVFGTNNAWKMMILPNGNVGIGRYQPSSKLDITGDKIRLRDPGNEENEWITLRTDGSAGFLDLSYSGGKLAIQGSNTGEHILLSPSTNARVGIHTWNPQYELDVTGNIRATGSVYYGGTEGIADGSAYWKPDYVFDNSYEKLNTEQVEEFLNNEGHLPWVTSTEQEKKENGEVTDMTRMAFETLESVENLQLQLIAHKNQIKELKTENDNLKARLEKLEGLMNLKGEK